MFSARLRLDLPPERIWAALADPTLYPDWVVGARRIRSVEGEWPEIDSRLHHQVGAGPVKVEDDTRVLACEPGRRLLLEAKIRPIGVAHVELCLQEQDGGTLVRMSEVPIEPVVLRLAGPLVELVAVPRNLESLRRLGRIAGGR